MKPKYTLSQEHMPLDKLDPELRQVNPVCLDILYHRGFQDSQAVRGILFPSFQNAIKPIKCRDIDPAIRTLAAAVRQGSEIVVYRDYDVDGITAGALAVETLSALGAKVHHYANEREVDGYGICPHGVDVILDQWPDTKVILTVDNGIVANEAIAYAASRGLTVVVTDHHEPSTHLPDAAAAVVDLKRKDEVYPYHDLCGCALIFRVILDLYRYMKKDPSPVLRTVDLVALATVADVVPLVGENRALVQEGIKLIECGQRPFFRAIARLFNVTELSAHYTLAFQYAPTLNSLSRMSEDTGRAVEALLSNDEMAVAAEVKWFQEVNQARKTRTQEQMDIAMSLIDPNSSDAAIVISSDQFDEGIVGIIAGRLKEEFWKPVIVLAQTSSGVFHGSGRSIDGLDLKKALDECSPLLMSYGGHKKAAGVTLDPSNLDAFKKQFNSLVEKELAGKNVLKEIPLATLLDEKCLTEQLVRDLRILEPYGEGFPEPLFGLLAYPDDVRYIGRENQHVKFICTKTNLAIIAWNMAQRVQAQVRARDSLPCKFIGKPGLNVWNGNVSVQFIQTSA